MSASTSAWLPAAHGVCPACGARTDPAATTRCGGCQLDLAHPAAARLAELDARLAELDARLAELDTTRAALEADRAVLLAALQETRPAGLAPQAPPTAGSERGAAVDDERPIWERLEAIAPPGTRLPRPARPAREPRPPLRMQTLLALAGGALLTAAAVIFAAVAWETLPALVQAAILIAATLLAAVVAVVLARRDLPTAAGALGLVAMGFAAVDVVAVDRGELLALGAFTPALAALVAAAVGWLLARQELRWTAPVAALATLIAAVVAVDATATTTTAADWALVLLGTAAGSAAAASALVWRNETARAIAGVGGAIGVLASGLAGAEVVAFDTPPLAPGPAILVVGLPLALFLVAAHRFVWALAPATLLASVAAMALTHRVLGAAADAGVSVAVGAALAAAVVWGAIRRDREQRLPLLAGVAVPLAAFGLVTIATVATGVTRALAVVIGDPWDPVAGWPWLVVTAGLFGVALLASPPARRQLPWVVAGWLVALAGALPAAVAWPLSLVAAAAATALATTLATATRPGAERRELPWPAPAGSTASVRPDPLAPLTLAVLACAWAAGDAVTLAIAAATTAALAAWLVLRGTRPTTRDPATAVGDGVRRRIALAVAQIAAGVAVAMAVDAAGGAIDVRLGAAIVAVFVAAAVAIHLDVEVVPGVSLGVGALATLLLPPLASTQRASGVLLLVAAAGWLGLATLGQWVARWASAVVVSIGVAVLLDDVGVEVVEAYTVVPALALGTVGSWWLIEDREVRTVPALAPALLVALVPSLVTLAGEPNVLARTLGLVVVAGLLAVVGVRGGWAAPTVAGGLTAIWVAATQLWIAAELVPRWVTFAVVGVLLVWLAATYERQQQRVQAVARQLDAMR
jgi:hypothetical protein